MAQAQKIRSGIPGLDDRIEGGFWPKSTIVILGSSGTGKSTFAIQFLIEGIENGEQALYVTLEEPPEQIMREADYNIGTRGVIDPMTPVIWATQDKLEQRELIGKLFYTLKELGVVLCTVEEHSRPGETIGEDVLLPIYLSDGAVHLEYYPIGRAFHRTVQG